MRYGIITDEPIEEYHSSGALSHSCIKFFRDNFPITYWQKYIGKTLAPEEPKKYFDIGNAAECLIAYGEGGFHKKFCIHPATYRAPASAKKDAPIIDKPWNWNANACNEWADVNGTGKTIISPADALLVGKMRDAVFRNPDAVALIKASTPQVTFRARGKSVSVQCRSDFWSHAGCVLPSTGEDTGPFDADLKTIEALSPSAFKSFDRQADELGYHLAQVFYRFVIRRVLAEIGGTPEDELPFVRRYFIVVDKKENPSCTVYTLPQVMIDEAESVLIGDSERVGLLQRLLGCYESGVWPDAPLTKEVEAPRRLRYKQEVFG